MSSSDNDTFTSSFLIWMSFIFKKFFLIALARTSGTMLNKSGENGYPYLTPDHRGKTFSISSSNIKLAVGLSYMVFILLKYIPFLPNLLRILLWKNILSNTFPAYIEMIIWFLTFILLMWCITFIDLWLLNYHCILGINPNWSWCMIHFMCCRIQFTSTLLRIFTSILSRDIGL